MPKTNSREYPNAIRQYRRKRGLKIAEVTRRLGRSSKAHVAHWEKGRKLPTLANALRLQLILQCPIEILFLDLRNALRDEIQSRLEPSSEDSI